MTWKISIACAALASLLCGSLAEAQSYTCTCERPSLKTKQGKVCGKKQKGSPRGAAGKSFTGVPGSDLQRAFGVRNPGVASQNTGWNCVAQGAAGGAGTAEAAPTNTQRQQSAAPASRPLPAPSLIEGRYTWIVNRWKPEQAIHIEQGPPTSGGIQQNWWSAQWVLEPVDGGFVRIRSRWKSNVALHNQNGRLEAGAVQPGWWSAMWKVEKVDGSFVRLRNRWKTDQALHNQNGRLESGPVQPGWWSAMWRVAPGSTGVSASASNGNLGVSATASVGGGGSCADQVQGKVAWNQAGNRKWNQTNVDQLCAGATDPPARIRCFEGQIAQRDDWQRAITYCTCHNEVQGKVAWNRAGDRRWNAANINKLCDGATDGPARIRCFEQQIASQGDWNRAISACR